MFNIMKNGGHVQYGTYEFIADSIEDVAVAPKTVAPGSKMLCIENSTTYIFTPSLEWVEYAVEGGGGAGGLVPVVLHEGEFDPETGVPTILNPNPQAIYFVPNGDGTSTEWVYVENKWEKLGPADIDLSEYVKHDELFDKEIDFNNYPLRKNSKYEEIGNKTIFEAINETSELPADVQIDGVSILDENKVANIPIASENTLGVVKTNSYSFGIGINASGQMYINRANNSQIDDRNLYPPITAGNVDYAVKQAMCDGKGAEWTDEEKASARARMGIAIDEDSLNTMLEEVYG